ncbi:MAG: fluoride efflux transporter CrcB [Paenibacillaceae bacterium]
MINTMDVWLVGLGGIVGTLCRVFLGKWIAGHVKGSFPWWTWVINLTGSLLLGILFALHNRELLSDEAWLMLGIGFCGAYTTFSTFGYEMQQLIEKKHVIAAAMYMLSSISLGVLLAWSGIVIIS